MPERTCVGCRRRRPTAELARLVLTPDGHPLVSRVAAGRGAWLCARDGIVDRECLALGVRRHGFARTWRRPVPAGALDELRRMGVDDDRHRPATRATHDANHEPDAPHARAADDGQRLPGHRQDGRADDPPAGRRVPGSVPARGKG